MSEKLKPCPFCGKKPCVWQVKRWRVGCINEECLWRVVTRTYDHKDNAIKAWNRRSK